jgi:hypothetical protein
MIINIIANLMINKKSEMLIAFILLAIRRVLGVIYWNDN